MSGSKGNSLRAAASSARAANLTVQGWTSTTLDNHLTRWMNRWSRFTHPTLADLRSLAEDQDSFLSRVLAKKRQYYGSRLRVLAVDPQRNPEIAKWVEENFEAIQSIERDVWNEWLLAGNIPALWIKDRPKSSVSIFDCEQLRYSNKFGNERVEPLFDVSKEDRKELGLPETGSIMRKLDFLVKTSTKKGRGFAKSPWLPHLEDMAILELLRMGDFSGAWARKKLVRQGKKGHKIEGAGPLAGTPTYFFKSDFGKAILKKLKEEGFSELISNFDFELEYVHLPPEFFDAKFYRAVSDRLSAAAGPAATLVELEATERRANQNVLDIFWAEALEQRGEVGPYLSTLLTRTLKPPAPVRVTWGDAVFMSRKNLIAHVQGAANQGFMSPQTARFELNLDDATESYFLREASKAETDYRPVFEPRQGLLSEQDAGRPAGTPDHE